MAGSKYTHELFDTDTDFAIARYNPNGSLDTSFDGDGRATAGLGEFDTAYGVALQADGRIVLAGESDDFDGDSDFALARYNRDGSLDSSFDGDGKLTTGLGADDHAFTWRSRTASIRSWSVEATLVGSTTSPSPATTRTARSTPRSPATASLRPGFGGIDSAEGVAIQSDGRIVAAGWSVHSGDVDFALARFTPSGAFDSSFSGNGKLLTDFFGQDDAALAVAIQPNGRIVAAGTSGTIVSPEVIRSPFAERFALTRYHGVADNTLPGTVIDSGPSGTTTDSTPTFGFHSTEMGSTFQCTIDAGSFVSCVSPHTTAPLADGAHTFRVRAIDPVGNADPTPATRIFTIQTASFQPDGRIRLEGDAAYIGDNIYNLTGDFQTRATTARRGETRNFYVRAGARLVRFDDGAEFDLPAEYLRVLSPSAEVQGHSPEQRQTVAGKIDVTIAAVDQVGNYAVRLTFSDRHNSGIFSWPYLRKLGEERDRALVRVSSRSRGQRPEPRARGARRRVGRPTLSWGRCRLDGGVARRLVIVELRCALDRHGAAAKIGRDTVILGGGVCRQRARSVALVPRPGPHRPAFPAPTVRWSDLTATARPSSLADSSTGRAGAVATAGSSAIGADVRQRFRRQQQRTHEDKGIILRPGFRQADRHDRGRWASAAGGADARPG